MRTYLDVKDERERVNMDIRRWTDDGEEQEEEAAGLQYFSVIDTP